MARQWPASPEMIYPNLCLLFLLLRLLVVLLWVVFTARQGWPDAAAPRVCIAQENLGSNLQTAAWHAVAAGKIKKIVSNHLHLMAACCANIKQLCILTALWLLIVSCGFPGCVLYISMKSLLTDCASNAVHALLGLLIKSHCIPERWIW